MNPFDLRGPEFLVFYAALSAIVLGWLAMFLRTGEPEGQADAHLSEDPFLVAYLRGGKNEALRVATISLIDRGLIKVDGTTLEWQRRGQPATEIVRRPLEKAILSKFKESGEAISVFDDPGLETICRTYEDQLTQLGLLPNEAIKSIRTQRRTIAFLILGGVAAIKIWVAIGRGRYNVGVLIMMAVAACMIAAVINPRLTKKGSELLADLQSLFSGLKERAANIQPGGATNELALLAAVFGLGVVPATVFPYTKTLYPKAAASGSSCGSTYSCGSSCGSSCGGGGCGGGCGGCGG